MIAIHVIIFQCMAHTCATHTDAPTWTHFTHICLPAMTASVNWKWPPNAQRRQAAKFTTTAGPPPHCTSPPLAVTLFLDWEYQQGNLQTVNSFPIPAARCISLLAKSDAMGCDAKQMEMQMQIHLDAMQTGEERKSDAQEPKDAKRVHQWASAMLSSWVCTGLAIC